MDGWQALALSPATASCPTWAVHCVCSKMQHYSGLTRGPPVQHSCILLGDECCWKGGAGDVHMQQQQDKLCSWHCCWIRRAAALLHDEMHCCLPQLASVLTWQQCVGVATCCHDYVQLAALGSRWGPPCQGLHILVCCVVCWRLLVVVSACFSCKRRARCTCASAASAAAPGALQRTRL